YFAALMRAKGSGPYDLIICAHINLLPFAQLFDAKTLLMIYGIEAWKPTRRGSPFLHRVDAIASISNITRDRFLHWSGFRGPAHLLPNAIHLDRYAIRPRNRELVARWHLDDARVLLTLGRIVAAERYKGFDEVIEVLPSLPDDIVYLAAGSGSDI